jgi:intracellular septation protein A
LATIVFPVPLGPHRIAGPNDGLEFMEVRSDVEICTQMDFQLTDHLWLTLNMRQARYFNLVNICSNDILFHVQYLSFLATLYVFVFG